MKKIRNKIKDLNMDLHNLDRFNSLCKAPFEQDGEMYYSYLCTVTVDYAVYYTYIYARNSIEAMEKLKNGYKEYENHTVVNDI